MDSVCPLCRESGEIVRSHIIPQFLLRLALGEERRAVAIRGVRKPARVVQQAFVHPLLCRSCDQFLGAEYEQPFSLFWRDAAPLVADRTNYLFKVPSYARCKLFLLSILWRAGVSDLRPFAAVQLAEHEPLLRDMIVSRQARSQHEYPVFGAVLLQAMGPQVAYSVVPPFEITMEGSRGYMAAFGGTLWVYLLRSEPLKVTDVEGWLLETGDINMPVVRMSDIGAIHETFMAQFDEAERQGWRNPY